MRAGMAYHTQQLSWEAPLGGRMPSPKFLKRVPRRNRMLLVPRAWWCIDLFFWLSRWLCANPKVGWFEGQLFRWTLLIPLSPFELPCGQLAVGFRMLWGWYLFLLEWFLLSQGVSRSLQQVLPLQPPYTVPLAQRICMDRYSLYMKGVIPLLKQDCEAWPQRGQEYAQSKPQGTASDTGHHDRRRHMDFLLSDVPHQTGCQICTYISLPRSQFSQMRGICNLQIKFLQYSLLHLWLRLQQIQ